MRQKRFLCLKGIVFAWLFTILLAAGGQHVCFAAEENVPQQTVYDDAALLTPEEIEKVEAIVNEEIAAALPVETNVDDG